MLLIHRSKFAPLLVSIALLFLVQPVLAGAPRFSTIQYPDSAGTTALGINPAGDIVGGWVDNANKERGFVLRNGTYTSIEYPGAAWTEAEGISPNGDIVGQYGLSAPDDPTLVHGFLLRNGTYTSIDIDGPNDQGSRNTMPYRINPDGKIVGCYHQSYPSGAVIMSGMQAFELGADGALTLDAASTMNGGINPQGTIVGHAYDMTLKRYFESYVIQDGVTTKFHYPEAFVTRAWDINARGDIVGMYRETTAAGKAGSTHGFLLTQGAITPINFPGATVALTSANGINTVGDIVGYYIDETGYHGFLLSRQNP